jgi:5,10-methenyltetrahydrofolate synthetase
VFKSKLRNRILKARKIANQNNVKLKFNKIYNLIKKKNLIKKNIIGGYFPINFEVDDLDILKEFYKKKYQICLPVIKKNYRMDFYKWNLNDPLKINKYGIPEPITTNLIYPDIILVPLVAFDKNLNRLGYGGGYYDRLIEKLSKKKKILKIGLALSIQKIKKVPVTKYDKKLDYILTENMLYD